MFSLGHFFWLGAIGITIALALITTKKLALSHRTVGRAVMMILIVLKIFHMSLSMKESAFGGYVLDQTQLSFHLCSLMIYSTILVNSITNQKIIATLKSFMVPCLLLGATMALLIPTEGVNPTHLRVWQYMLIHGMLVFYGIYLAAREKVDLSFLRETFPKSEEERARRANTPLTPEEIDAYIDALCPPSLRPPEDEKG